MQDGGEVGDGDIACATGGEALEGVVVWAEDCYVGEVFEGGDEGGLCGGAG